MSELSAKQPSSEAFSFWDFTPLNSLSLQLRGTAILVAIFDCGLRNNPPSLVLCCNVPVTLGVLLGARALICFSTPAFFQVPPRAIQVPANDLCLRKVSDIRLGPRNSAS